MNRGTPERRHDSSNEDDRSELAQMQMGMHQFATRLQLCRRLVGARYISVAKTNWEAMSQPTAPNAALSGCGPTKHQETR
jgi:hypothetical protein